MPIVSATYCATEAVAVNEMSIPPATSTTSSPEARMPTKAFDVSKSNRFCRVRKLSVASESTSESARTTASSQNSWLRRQRDSAPVLGIDHRLQLLLRRGTRDALAGQAPATHHQHTVRVIEDFGNLIGDEQDGDPAGG